MELKSELPNGFFHLQGSGTNGSLEIKRVVKKQREGNDYVGPWPLGEFHSFLDKDRYEGYY